MRINIIVDSIPPETTLQSSKSNLENKGQEDTKGKEDTASDPRSHTVNPYAPLTQAGVSRKFQLHSALNKKWSDKYKKTDTKFSDFDVLQLLMQTVHDPKIANAIAGTKIHADLFNQPTARFRHAVKSIVTLGLGQFAMDEKPGFHLWASDQSPSQVHELMQYFGKGRPWRKDIVVVRGEARSGREDDISAEKYQFLIMFKPEKVRELILHSPTTFMLPENASNEDVERCLQNLARPEYYQELWDKSIASEDPEYGLNVDNMIKTIMGWGAKNSELGTRHVILISELARKAKSAVTMEEKSYMQAKKQFPEIAKKLDDLGSFENSKTLLQIIEALPEETLVRPETIVFWDIDETEEVVPSLIDSSQRVGAALKQSYEKLDSKEISSVDFVVQEILSNLFEK